IAKITESLLDQINQQLGNDPGFQHKKSSATTISYVKGHPWPGNVRQLYNALLQAAIMSDGDTIHREHLVAATGESANLLRRSDVNDHPLGNGFSLDELLNTIRSNYLRRGMEESRGV